MSEFPRNSSSAFAELHPPSDNQVSFRHAMSKKPPVPLPKRKPTVAKPPVTAPKPRNPHENEDSVLKSFDDMLDMEEHTIESHMNEIALSEKSAAPPTPTYENFATRQELEIENGSHPEAVECPNNATSEIRPGDLQRHDYDELCRATSGVIDDDVSPLKETRISSGSSGREV